MSRARRRADRIREEVDITQLLADYGYQVHAGYTGEEQFSCDLHGDGHDTKPSARVYPESQSWYCFACDQTRDCIETVREKEGIGFWEAIRVLEKRYNLPPLPWEDDGEDVRRPSPESVVAEALKSGRTWEDDRKRVHTLLTNLTKDRDLAMMLTAKLWEAFDKVDYLVRKERLASEDGRVALEKIRVRAMEQLKELSS